MLLIILAIMYSFTRNKELLRNVEENRLDEDIVVSDFEQQSLYYIHFQINTLESGI